MEGKHFDPKGKPPSNSTVELQKPRHASLPFEDKRDFDELEARFRRRSRLQADHV